MKQLLDKYGYWMKIPAMLNLGMLLIVAGVGKLLYQSNSFAPAPFLETLPGAMWFYTVLPYIEIAIGLLLVSSLMVKFAATMAAGLVLIFAGSNIFLITIGQGYDLCGCFGMAGRLTYVDALVVDAIMGILVAVIFICQRGSYFNMIPWFLDSVPIGVKQQA